MCGCDQQVSVSGTDAGAVPAHDRVALARIAYRAYGDRTGWRNFRGDPMPPWQDLGEVIQGAWQDAAAAVARSAAAPPAASTAGDAAGDEVAL